MGTRRTLYVLRVREKRTLLPSELEAAIPEGYRYRGATIEIAGRVAKEGERLAFEARGSNQAYALDPAEAERPDGTKGPAPGWEDLGKLLAQGKAKVALTGRLKEQPEDVDGRKRPPLIEVTAARELPEAERKQP